MRLTTEGVSPAGMRRSQVNSISGAIYLGLVEARYRQFSPPKNATLPSTATNLRWLRKLGFKPLGWSRAKPILNKVFANGHLRFGWRPDG